MIDRQTNIGA